MTLYRYNLRLAQELLTIVSCFEVSLRNAIDDILVPLLGNEWVKILFRLEESLPCRYYIKLTEQ